MSNWSSSTLAVDVWKKTSEKSRATVPVLTQTAAIWLTRLWTTVFLTHLPMLSDHFAFLLWCEWCELTCQDVMRWVTLTKVGDASIVDDTSWPEEKKKTSLLVDSWSTERMEHPALFFFVPPANCLTQALYSLTSANPDKACSQQISPLRFQPCSLNLNYSQLMNNALYLKLASGGYFCTLGLELVITAQWQNIQFSCLEPFFFSVQCIKSAIISILLSIHVCLSFKGTRWAAFSVRPPWHVKECSHV